ncbi:hypothetical protein MIT9_P0991 [Methylomarinovum caldicuralii]|uniref:Putative restriction endonuclease domain-containing protein n=1 Tax=Methylomarinovum caldicuralii TaxID=438856 RepID=A0AAU9CN99_9GAMM|nr:Uma2 family endonuclease [Methylomarinovum caldicuralii]BCX81413.1 hypothetical protein MIT9_P0991 [Methylomarinovum caldicuralii]
MGVPEVQRRYTYADYLTWPENERWELIDGVAYDMSPAPTRRHQEIVVEICRQFANQLADRRCRVYVAPFDVRLGAPGLADDEIDTVVQPDVSVWCDPSKLDERGARGAPDLAVEVLSPHTAAKDLTVKRELYARVGVVEYWTIEPLDRVLMIWRLEGNGYGAPHITGLKGVMASRIAGLQLDLDLLASVLEDL